MCIIPWLYIVIAVVSLCHVLCISGFLRCYFVAFPFVASLFSFSPFLFRFFASLLLLPAFLQSLEQPAQVPKEVAERVQDSLQRKPKAITTNTRWMRITLTGCRASLIKKFEAIRTPSIFRNVFDSQRLFFFLSGSHIPQMADVERSPKLYCRVTHDLK